MRLNQEAKAFKPFSIEVESLQEAVNLKEALHHSQLQNASRLAVKDAANTMYQLIDKAIK